MTASEAHRHPGRLDLDSLADPGDYTRYTSFLPYGRSKLYDLLFTQELARRLDGTGVTANCFCPGAVGTGLLAENKLIDAGGRVLSYTPIIRTPAQGARMGIRLATDPGLESVSGEFFTSTPGLRFMRTAPSRRDRGFQRDLWERTAEVVGV
jgi:NAD(P)-dependent dehydrogenase (short-subunit alcohol dehydrogenase family)